MPANLGSAEYTLAVNNAELERGMKEAERTVAVSTAKQAQAVAASSAKIAAEHKKAADAAVASAKRMGAAMDSATRAGGKGDGGFGALTAGAAKFGLAAAGVASASSIVGSAISSMTEEVQKAAQAQFAFSAVFQGTSAAYVSAIEAQAEATKQTTTAVMQTMTAFGSLANRYGLTIDQIKELTKRSADLAAVTGMSATDAAKRLEAALRGEAESAEALGLTLNSDYLKKFAVMTDEQRKNWETLGPLQKAQITYNEALKQTEALAGKAAERANSDLGAVDRLGTAWANLAKSMGELYTPAVQKAAGWTARIVEQMTAAQVAAGLQEKAIESLNKELGENARLTQEMVDARVEQIKQLEQAQKDMAAGLPSPVFGPSLKEADDNKKKLDADHEAAQERVKRALAEQEDALDAQLALEKEAIAAERQAKNDWYDEERSRIEARRHYQLQDIEQREQAAIASLERQAKAAEDAIEAEIELAGQRKDAELDAIDARKEAEDARIEAVKRRLDQERTLEDRAQDDARDREDQDLDAVRALEDEKLAALTDRLHNQRRLEDQAIQDQRAAEDAARDAARESEDRERDDRREKEDRERDDSRAKDAARLASRAASLRAAREAEEREIDNRREQEDRAAEAAHEKLLEQTRAEHEARISAIDAQMERVRALADAELEALREAADQAREEAEAADQAREDARDAALDRLDEEADARKAAHDEYVDQLEQEEERLKDRAEAVLDGIEQQGRAEDDRHRQALSAIEAEKDARLAAVDAELGLLDAQDTADDRAKQDRDLADAVTNATFGVAKAESTGNQSEIVAARQKLADAEDAIRQTGVDRERDALRKTLLDKKQAISEEIEARKKAEQEQNRLNEERLKATADTVKAELEEALKGIKGRRDGADESLEKDLEGIKVRRDAVQAAYETEKAQAEAALQARLKEIEERQKAVKGETEATIKLLQDQKDAQEKDLADALKRIKDEEDARKLALGDRRKKEDDERADHAKKEDDALDRARRRLDEKREKEDRERGDRRTKEDRERSDERKAEDTAIAESRTAEDRRRTEERLAEDAAIKEQTTRRTVARQEEDRLIAESRTAQDRRRADERTAEDLALQDQSAAAEAARQLERKAVDDHYNGPGGVIPLLKKSLEDTKVLYSQRLTDTKTAYENERKAAEALYTNPEGTGLLDQLKKQREAENRALDQSGKDWEAWAKRERQAIKDAKADLDAFIEKLKDLGFTGEFVPTPGGSKPPKQSGEGSGGGSGGGQMGAGGVPSPWKVSFPFNAPYNPDGKTPAWPGGPPRHRGVDLILPGSNNGRGTTYGAFRGGKVVAAGPMSYPSGNGVMIETPDGLTDVYFHNDAVKVKRGDTVKRGEDIAVLGNKGTEEFPHVHYEVRKNPGGDPIGSTIDPVPYMGGGGGGGGQTIDVILFGKTFRVTVPAGMTQPELGDALLDAIEKFGTEAGGKAFGRAATAIAASETGGGKHLEQIGGGGGRGPYQFDPGGELIHYAKALGVSVKEAGERAVAMPMEAVAYALTGDGSGYSGRGYLGRALKKGIKDDLEGRDLADFGSRVGQRPYGDNWKEAGVWHERLYGYANGGWINRPSLIVDERSGQPYARAGETHPEWVGPVGAEGSGQVRERMAILVQLGNMTIERLAVTGIKLATERGTTLSDLGLK
jgi:murein DD-endopeptidase MepM/ murein hydrolase activator NlpD